MPHPSPSVTLTYNPALDRFELAGIEIDYIHLRTLLSLLRHTARTAHSSKVPVESLLPQTKAQLRQDLEAMTEGIAPTRIARSTAKELAQSLTLDDLEL